MSKPVSANLLRELFRIDLDRGQLFWINPPKFHPRMLNKEAGSARRTQGGKNYWVIKIGRRAYKRGRLIYFLSRGRWPKPCVDHKNGDSLDDRKENLRSATVLQNAWNHKTRKRSCNLPMGVRVNHNGKFGARISYMNRQIHLGAYDSAEQASSVYQSKRKELFGEWA